MLLTNDHGTATARARFLALSLLFLVALLNYLDRYMLGILLPAIKADLHLSDSELGFITGIAFSIFYAVMGIPIGRLADRFSRRAVIAGTLALWSAMTVACGLAQGFVQLVLARVMVGVGEAGATPPAHSLISDLFPASRRAGALSVFSLGLPVGVLVSFMAGGVIAQNLGWRPALLAFGVPGVMLAAVIFLVLPEPARGSADGLVLSRSTTLRQVMATLIGRQSFRHVCLGSGFFTLLWLGLISWLPSFFTRTFNLPIGEVGTKLALVLGLSQFIGLAVGGVLGDRLSRRDGRWYMWICAAGSLLPMPFYAAALLSPRADLAFLALIPVFIFGLLQGAPAVAIVQGLAGPRMRAVAVATYLVVVNVIAGGGPQLIGLLSDRLGPSLGASALGVSILGVALPFSVWSGWHFWRGARTLRADFAAALRD